MTDDAKRMKLRYAGTCHLCGTDLPARTEAIYERSTKTVRCLTCQPAEATDAVVAQAASEVYRDLDAAREQEADLAVEAIDVGTPGASARREFERRHAKREARIRDKHPKLGGLILAMSDDPQSTTAWNTGALGEERLGNCLNQLSSDNVRVLHDRRIPGTKANIDHIAVTPTGIYVIDAKRYKGRPSLKIEGGIFRPRTEKLLVGSRDCTKLVDGVLKQVTLVSAVAGDDIPVTGVLCFVEADWPLIGGAFTTRGVEVLWPRKLYPRLSADGPHSTHVAAVHAVLAAAFPPA